jgi:hypothetical protein
LGMLWLADIALGGETIIFFMIPYKNRRLHHFVYQGQCIYRSLRVFVKS